MMTDALTQWARDHNIPLAAVNDLRARLVAATPTDPAVTPKPQTEAEAQQAARLEASRQGWRLWRNNVGVARDERGAVVRFGLCNDSAPLNKRVKSSDLIGIRPVVVTPSHTGITIGQFVARECKAPGWRYTGTPREVAQKRFLDLVTAFGGDASFSC